MQKENRNKQAANKAFFLLCCCLKLWLKNHFCLFLLTRIGIDKNNKVRLPFPKVIEDIFNEGLLLCCWGKHAGVSGVVFHDQVEVKVHTVQWSFCIIINTILYEALPQKGKIKRKGMLVFFSPLPLEEAFVCIQQYHRNDTIPQTFQTVKGVRASGW